MEMNMKAVYSFIIVTKIYVSVDKRNCTKSRYCLAGGSFLLHLGKGTGWVKNFLSMSANLLRISLSPSAELILRNKFEIHLHFPTFINTFLNNEAGSSMRSLWNEKDSLCSDAITTEDRTRQRARWSAVMLLIWFARDIPLWAPKG